MLLKNILLPLFVCLFRRSQDRERDLKLLLDTYKCLPKESRDKAQVREGDKNLPCHKHDTKSHSVFVHIA